MKELKNNKIIFDAYKRYKTSNPDFLANDEMFKIQDKPAKTYRFFTQEEFINKIKTDDKFAKKLELTFKSE
jgi:hypothetical protein